MSAENEEQPIIPQQQATNKGVDIVLNEDALASLTSYFDLLIQMDLEQQGNERDSHGKDVHKSVNEGVRRVRAPVSLTSDKARDCSSTSKKKSNN